MYTNPDDLVRDLRTSLRRFIDTLWDGSYTPDNAAKLFILERVSIRIEPTPTTDSGPVIVDFPDTATARIHGSSVLHSIIDPVATTHRLNWRFRSNSNAEVQWR